MAGYAPVQPLRHIIYPEHLPFELRRRVFLRAYEIKQDFAAGRRPWNNQYNDRIMEEWFAENSTRTDVCFNMGAVHFNMRVVARSGVREISSFGKGELDIHTAAMLSGYHPDIIVVRSDEEGAVAQMAEWSDVPIINAGDGPGTHTTQGVLDAFTMINEKGREGTLAGCQIVIGGDTSGRAVTSLVPFLPDYFPRAVHFVSARALRPRKAIRDYLKSRNVPFTETEDLEEVLPHADIIYWMRTQTNHHSDEIKEALQGLDFRKYQIRPEHMERARPGAILMHPLPIKRRIDEEEAKAGVVTEIVPELDRHPQTRYFHQARYGLYVRMALIEWIFDDLPSLDMLLRLFRNTYPGVSIKF